MQRWAWVTLVCLGVASPAWAGPPELFQYVADFGDANAVSVAYAPGGGGFYFSEDGGKTFGNLCTEAIEPGLVETDFGGMRQLPDGRFILGLFDGMLISDASHCKWSRVSAFEMRWVSELVADPEDPAATYAITSTGEGDNGLYRNDGKSDEWKAIGKLAPEFLTRLHIVKTSGGTRMYISGLSPAASATESPRYFIRVSDDRGATWTEHAFGDTDGSMRLLAVDPSNPDNVVVGVQRSQLKPDDLLFSSMQGKPDTFQKISEVTTLAGAAFTADGALFYGDNEQMTPGFFKVDKLGSEPKKLTTDKVSCLRYDAANKRLYMCRDWLFGTADPGTGAFTTLIDMRTATEFISCESTNRTAFTCRDQYAMNFCGAGHYPQAPLCAKHYPDVVAMSGYVAGSGGGDAGSGGSAAGSGGTGGQTAMGAGTGAAGSGGAVAGSGAGEGGGGGDDGTTPPKSGCDCSTGVRGAGATNGGMLALGVALVCATWRRRRRSLRARPASAEHELGTRS